MRGLIAGRRGALQRHQGRRGDQDRAGPHQPAAGSIARARVTSDVPIRVDSYATLEPQGITGVNYVQITAGTPTKPLLKDTAARAASIRDPEQPARAPSPTCWPAAARCCSATVEALDRVNRVLSDENIKTFSGDAQRRPGGHRRAARAQGRSSPTPTEALQDIDAAAEQHHQAQRQRQRPGDGDGKRALHNIADAADEAKATATDLRAHDRQAAGPDHRLRQQRPAAAHRGGRPSCSRRPNPWTGWSARSNQARRRLISKAPAKEVKVKP